MTVFPSQSNRDRGSRQTSGHTYMLLRHNRSPQSRLPFPFDLHRSRSQLLRVPSQRSSFRLQFPVLAFRLDHPSMRNDLGSHTNHHPSNVSTGTGVGDNQELQSVGPLHNTFPSVRHHTQWSSKTIALLQHPLRVLRWKCRSYIAETIV